MDVMKVALLAVMALSLLATTVFATPVELEDDAEFKLRSIIEEVMSNLRDKREVTDMTETDPSVLLTRLRRSMAGMYMGRNHYNNMNSEDYSRWRHRARHQHRRRYYGGGQISDA